MRGGVLRAHVDEHLAVAERVELGLALGPRWVRRHRLEDAEVAVERDPGIVARCVGDTDHRTGFRPGQPGVRRASAVAGTLLGVWVRSVGCTRPSGERAAAAG